MHTVYLSLGSNLEPRLGSLLEACERLDAHSVKILRKSGIYETEPWGFLAETHFLNAVIEVSTCMEPSQLLHAIAEVESAMGRFRNTSQSDNQRYASRRIDVDVLFFDDLMIHDATLSIPHPKMHLRNFVLIPMVDLAPAFIHPLLNLRMDELLKACPDVSELRPYGPWPESMSTCQVSTIDLIQ